MKIEQLRNQLGDFAKDIRLNLAMVLTSEGAAQLSQKQILIIALACAFALDHGSLVETLATDCSELLSKEEINAVRSAAAIMAMNNIYYRFTHLISDKTFAGMPPKLRMNVISKPGLAKIDFELACLAVSALNGCGMCMESHVKALQNAGVSNDSIQSAIRIAAVLNAVKISI